MKREALGSIVGLVTDRDLVLAFFAMFSRFEYALKRARFLKQKEKAEPNWDLFSNSVRGQLLSTNDEDFQTARQYLLSEPPNTQVVAGNELQWQSTVAGPGETEEHYLLRLVQTVRNNLFHGGKYPYPFQVVPDIVRNRQLLESAIAVLERCLAISPAVGVAFTEVA
jgi:hypothetical protein